MTSEGGSVSHSQGALKRRRTSRRPSHLARLSRQSAQLRQVEGRMDDLFRQLLDALSDPEIERAEERMDELVSTCPELRLTNLGQHPLETWLLVSRLDLEAGPLPGFRQAMEQLRELVLTPQAVYGLRSRLYTVAARLAQKHPELLPTAAIAVLAYDGSPATWDLLSEMVICASAIEWLFTSE